MPSAPAEHPSELSVVREAVDAERCASWHALADAAVGGSMAATGRVSLLVDDVAGLDVGEVWCSLGQPVRERCAAAVGAPVALDADQCWVRYQPAPAEDPAGHHPHRWHQDGALRFDFLARPEIAPPATELLDMVTCWIALTPCGIDAPGLELVTSTVDRLLPPADLREDAVDGAWPWPQRQRPVCAAGDVAVFTGAVLHRTHVTPEMQRARISLELRCFCADALPARLRGDRFIVVVS